MSLVKKVIFPSIKVGLNNNKFITDFYVKPNDHHQYLEYLVAHSYHAKNSFAFSQTLCISRLCSSEKEILVQEKGVLKRSD